MIGIRCYKGDRGFIHHDRSIDFLVDGDKIKKEDVIFCIESPIDYEDELKKRGYEYVKMWELARHIIPSDFIGTPLWGLRAIYTHLTWRVFCRFYAIDHYVVYNDFTPWHKVRNKVLKSFHVETWYYIHSTNNIDRYGVAMSDIDTIFKGMEYDHMIVWGQVDKHFENIGVSIGQYHKLGCLWGSQ